MSNSLRGLKFATQILPRLNYSYLYMRHTRPYKKPRPSKREYSECSSCLNLKTAVKGRHPYTDL